MEPDEASDDLSFDPAEENEAEMPWESYAREAVEEAGRSIEFDDVRGLAYLQGQEFSDWERLQRELERIGEDEWVGYAPTDSGEIVVACYPPFFR